MKRLALVPISLQFLTLDKHMAEQRAAPSLGQIQPLIPHKATLRTMLTICYVSPHLVLGNHQVISNGLLLLVVVS